MTGETGSLTRVLRRGAMLSAVGLVLTQGIAFAQTLVLARLLTPAEVGLFAAGTVLTGLLFIVTEGGLRVALVQRDEADLEVAANTVLWATVVAGLLLAAGALAVAPLIGTYFASPLVGRVSQAVAPTLLLQSLTHVPDALMQRRFQFRRRLVTDPSVALAFAVVAVPACALGAGVWGLVAGLYASEVAWLVASWSLAGWRPGAAAPSWRVWREMATFSFPLVLGATVDRARQLFEVAAVGRVLGPSALGWYRYGRRLGELPARAIVDVGGYVLFPAFARIASDPARMRGASLRALRLLWAAAIPMAGLMIALGAPVVVVLLGDPWRGAGPLIVAMAGWGPGLALSAVGVEALKGAGRSRPLNLRTAVTVGVWAVGLAVLMPWWGLAGVGLAVSAQYLVGGVLAIVLARSVLGWTSRELGGAVLPPVVAGVTATVVTVALEHGALHADARSIPVGVLFLLCDVLVFAGMYLGVLRAVDPRGVAELVAAVRPRGAPHRSPEEDPHV